MRLLILLLCGAAAGRAQSTGAVHRIAEFQVALDRQLFSPGCVDDQMGPQTRAALRAWQVANGLPVSGAFDNATAEKLKLDVPAFIEYPVSSNDFACLGRAPESWRERAAQDAMPYETILELVAEKFHASQRFLRALNPQIPWETLNTPTRVLVPNVIKRNRPKPRKSASTSRRSG